MIPDEAVEAAARALSPAVWGPSVWQFAAHGETPTAARVRVQQQSLQDARPLLEAAAPHMHMDVTTVEHLDGLLRFTVIRANDGLVFERQTMWHEAGSRDLKYSPDIILPATVLQMGWGEE